MDFIDWLLDLEEYFNFWMICDEEKVKISISFDRNMVSKGSVLYGKNIH